MKHLFITLIAFLTLTSGTYQDSKPDFSFKTYGNIANYFENENDLLHFFEFKKRDVVSEIGAGDGQNIAGLSLLTDSITFYVQDINAKTLNEKSFNKIIAKCEKYKKPLTNTYKLLIGTEKASLLPDNSFDKILLSATFHEFTFMDEMISDIYKKLKSGGKLYILESECLNKDHKNYSAEQTAAILQKHNFSLLKKDGKNLNGATGLFRLIYTKNSQ